MLFSLLKHHCDLNITDTALKVSRSLYCFTTSISHGVENYFPRLWGTGISDAIFYNQLQLNFRIIPVAIPGVSTNKLQRQCYRYSPRLIIFNIEFILCKIGQVPTNLQAIKYEENFPGFFSPFYLLSGNRHYLRNYIRNMRIQF